MIVACTNAISDGRPRRRGFTLTELVLSMTIMTMLLGAITSTILVASHVIDDGTSPAVKNLAAAQVVDQITADLTYALTFSERTSQAVTFSVPDRDADSVPETIRYSWSGVAGDALTRQYNGGEALVIAEDVQHFDLNYLLRTVSPPTEACCFDDGSCADLLPDDCLALGGMSQGEDTYCATFDCPQPEACCLPWAECRDLPPGFCEAVGGIPQGLGTACFTYECQRNVLFVVDNGSPKDEDLARKVLVESWGYTVTLISDQATQAEFDAALADSVVVYISGETGEGDIGTKLTNATIGVVTEQRKMPRKDKLGIWEKDWQEYDGTGVAIDDNTHYITSDFGIGPLTILSDTWKLLKSDGNPSAGARTLASKVSDPARKTLVIIDAGATLYDGSRAAGRRVAIPWSCNVPTSDLNVSGMTLMRRAIEWAARED